MNEARCQSKPEATAERIERDSQPSRNRRAGDATEHPNNLIFCDGDLVEFSQAQFIAHQCNCVSKGGKGLYTTITKRYPSTEIYSIRTERSKPGTILVLPTGKSDGAQFVVHMFAQLYPGRPKSRTDLRHQRSLWFVQCLLCQEIEQHLHQWEDLKSDGKDSLPEEKESFSQDDLKMEIPRPAIAFPENIGCGLAGGKWEHYRDLIIDFARRNSGTMVYVVRKP